MTHRAMRVGIFFLTAAAVLLLAGASAQAEESAAKPIIAKIHADWCGTCTQLNPTMVELEKRVGDEAIVVNLDVSDKDAVARSAAEADRLGIRKFFDSYKSKTGTVGIIDADGKIVQIYKGELDVDKYVSALERAEKEA